MEVVSLPTVVIIHTLFNFESPLTRGLHGVLSLLLFIHLMGHPPPRVAGAPAATAVPPRKPALSCTGPERSLSPTFYNR